MPPKIAHFPIIILFLQYNIYAAHINYGITTLQLKGGGRLPPAERKYRQKQAKEQIKAGIGKSVWRREHGTPSRKSMKQTEKISSLRTNLDEIKSAVVNMDNVGFDNNLPIQEQIPGKNVENLSQLEAKVKDLLQTIKKEKGAAIRQERKGKQNRRKLKRNEVRKIAGVLTHTAHPQKRSATNMPLLSFKRSPFHATHPFNRSPGDKSTRYPAVPAGPRRPPLQLEVDDVIDSSPSARIRQIAPCTPRPRHAWTRRPRKTSRSQCRAYAPMAGPNEENELVPSCPGLPTVARARAVPPAAAGLPFL